MLRQLLPAPLLSRRTFRCSLGTKRLVASSAPADDSGSGAGGKGAGRGRRTPARRAPQQPRTVEQQVQDHMQGLQERSGLTFTEDAQKVKRSAAKLHGESPMFRIDWRKEPGHEVAYRFRLREKERQSAKDADAEAAKAASGSSAGSKKDDKRTIQPPPYTDYTGMRFPTLETAENYDYHQDEGIYKVVERAFPIKVPGHRRLDPYLREYIHFLHDLDPARFTIDRIAERYRLRAGTVRRVVQEWGRNRFLTRSGLTKLSDKRTTKEAIILQKKEEAYARWAGYDQLGDQDDPETDDEALGKYRGWKSTNDWVRRQNVEVEMMSAFPMMEKRDAMPKRVDVDLVVENTNRHKIINWIDPTDKVVF
eukprot:TRINITY_DN2457_c0_g5_i1.p1 TRINITY_DN2457_c0_g5~~TRINITY_DN2457_c0_g5_i1.p1  ORF type:complete len:365 (+),score=65.13 TRINITY_DN2457_c0_g5_i1:156-1250(+)